MADFVFVFDGLALCVFLGLLGASAGDVAVAWDFVFVFDGPALCVFLGLLGATLAFVFVFAITVFDLGLDIVSIDFVFDHAFVGNLAVVRVVFLGTMSLLHDLDEVLFDAVTLP